MTPDTSPFLNYNDELRIREGRMILWDQLGKIQHVTTHLNDSIPQKEQKLLIKLKESFEKLHQKPWDEKIQKTYYELIGKRNDVLLDKGYGSCVFKEPQYRKILEDAILYYNKEYYHLISFVIMPNHIHLLLTMEDGYKIEEIMGKLKRFVTTQLNKKIGRRGSLWTKEVYCRLMRSEEHLKFTKSYIKSNPKFLRAEEFTYWENKEFLTHLP